ncbi:MAG: NAD-dependent epimerase/dehydratase family protein [Mariprofundaceae bacterium]|nr:NAD-dependent epimerase/dehydratase family protein [Mariprofundaceae bacterium]
MQLNVGTVLVTGGAGFVGSHTVDALLEAGARVRVLDNLSTGKTANLPLNNPSLDFQIGDTRDQEAVCRAMRDVSHCLHLAAQVSVEKSFQYPETSSDNNIGGFINVLQAAKDAGVQRVVYASSAAAYGDVPQLPVAEDSLLLPGSPYGIEKTVNEVYARLYETTYSLPCLGLRYFNIYGPRQGKSSSYSGVISVFLEKARSMQPITLFGDGKQTRDFIFVKDVARCNFLALTSNVTGVCNVGCGNSISLHDLLDAIGRFTTLPEVKYLPARKGDIRHSCADVERMHRMLELFATTTLEVGLSELWQEKCEHATTGDGHDD